MTRVHRWWGPGSDVAEEAAAAQRRHDSFSECCPPGAGSRRISPAQLNSDRTVTRSVLERQRLSQREPATRGGQAVGGRRVSRPRSATPETWLLPWTPASLIWLRPSLLTAFHRPPGAASTPPGPRHVGWQPDGCRRRASGSCARCVLAVSNEMYSASAISAAVKLVARYRRTSCSRWVSCWLRLVPSRGCPVERPRICVTAVAWDVPCRTSTARNTVPLVTAAARSRPCNVAATSPVSCPSASSLPLCSCLALTVGRTFDGSLEDRLGGCVQPIARPEAGSPP
ncbi:hypothetical protein LQK93_03987 [Terrabacter sp. BE26]